MESLSVSEGWIGFLFGIFSASYLIAAGVAVSLVNKYGKKISMICSIILLEASTLLFAFGTSYWVLLIARILQGASSGVMWTASMSLVADYYPSNEQGTVYGVVNVSMGAGVFAGPVLGGALMDWGGHQKELPFLVIVGIAGIDGIARLFISEPKVLQPSEDNGWRFLLKDKNIMLVCFSVLIAQGVLTAVEPTLPLFYSEKMGLSPFWIGLMVGVPLIAFTISSPIVGKLIDKFPEKRNLSIAIGLIFIAASFPFLSYTTNIVGQVACLIILGIGDALTATPAMPEINFLIEQKYDSGYFTAGAAMNNSFYSAGSFLGPIFAASLVQFIGLVPAFASTGSVVLLFSIIFIIGLFMKPKKHTTTELTSELTIPLTQLDE